MNFNPTRRVWPAIIFVVASALAIAGWRLFWFQTDDAYIAFRYVSNSLAGRGLVWNPAPFRPVEGYTSLLWVLILREVWQFTRVAPPQAANVLSLAFGLATLLLGLRFLLRMPMPGSMEKWRQPLAAIALFGTVTNRTFLAWLSSGLETALFNFLITCWLFEALIACPRLMRLSIAAALCALCRPDGMLLCAATVCIIALERRRPIALLPLLIVPLHVAWRWRTYGDWLPNTYRAKYAGAWPQSGLRYLGCFVIEYGLWIWIALAIAFLIRARWRPSLWSGAIAIATICAHAAYYTLIIGGDHFEYRVYSHLILLLFISGAWLAAHVANRGWVATVLLGAFVLASYPIPWTHWAATHNLESRADTHVMIRPIADEFPSPMRPVVALWDEWQTWLIEHRVCMRHQEHKVFAEQQLRSFPSREEGERIAWDDHPVTAGGTVGIPGWVLPNVAIIDTHGLNDRVIARTPISGSDRLMAHDRNPPPGYVACFRPNVSIDHGVAHVMPRDRPLTDDEIRRCEDWSDAK